MSNLQKIGSGAFHMKLLFYVEYQPLVDELIDSLNNEMPNLFTFHTQPEEKPEIFEITVHKSSNGEGT